MAYDDLLNEVSRDPMPTLGAGPYPTEATADQYAYGTHYTSPPQTTSQASDSATYGSLSNQYDALSYDWTNFGPCTTSCGQGYKRRVRRCDVPQRCPDKIDEDVQLCYNAPCEGMNIEKRFKPLEVKGKWSRYSTTQ